MIHIEIVTLFPELFDSFLRAALLGKAVASGLVQVSFTNPRDFAPDKHRLVDDAPYGGGPGMVMAAPPLVAALESIASARGPAHRVLLTPTGAPLTQARVRELAKLPRLVLVCGRYEGVDERVRELAIDEELSLGDFVLTGGEPAAMALVDAVARYVPGVLGDATSTDEESFSAGLLEYPHYTRPPEFRGLPVPDTLLSGDHAKIRAWRHAAALERTRLRRPDLYARLGAGATDAGTRALAARTHIALVHHPVYDKSHRVVTTAITNLDIHDLARAARTYGLASYSLITPVDAQRELAERIIGHWTAGDGREMNDKRSDALALVRTSPSIDETITHVTQSTRAAAPPYVVATAARGGHATLSAATLRSERSADPSRPMLVLFGTGWGLEDSIFSRVHATLDPIRGGADYNHLSVRAAAAITLDRLFGR
jgi:tRNA (guanine37-N1)-methyltransferase